MAGSRILEQQRGYWDRSLSACRMNGLIQAECARQRKIFPAALSFWSRGARKQSVWPGVATSGTSLPLTSGRGKTLLPDRGSDDQGPPGQSINQPLLRRVNLIIPDGVLLAGPAEQEFPSLRPRLPSTRYLGRRLRSRYCGRRARRSSSDLAFGTSTKTRRR